MADKNIFSALAKYSSSAEENYLTESFVFLLNSLLEKERPIGLEILSKLCAHDNEFFCDDNEDISVTTQEIIEQGILDIKVASPGKLTYIEVKDYSPVVPDQLKRYKNDLDTREAIVKRLILLTRFPVDFSEHQSIPDKHIRWSEVYDWLTGLKAQDTISIYLIDSFKSYLEAKHMTIQKVGWEYINGVSAFNNLVNMIEAAIQKASLRYKKGDAWEYKGFYIDGSEFWCGVAYDDHLSVSLELVGKKKFNTKLVDNPSYPIREGYSDSYFFQLELEDKSIHFFSLSKEEQLDEITKFVKTAYTEAQKMRIKDE